MMSPQAFLKSRRPCNRGFFQPGFTLVEMMVAVTILVIIIGVIFALTQQTVRVYKLTGDQMESFRSARNAFESMTRNLSLATLNNYYDYVDASGSTRGQALKSGSSATINAFTPVSYARTSDLHFVSGWYGGSSTLYPNQVTHSVFFQAPLGYTASTNISNLENVLNACGYYIEYKADQAQPGFVSATPLYRYRLMEFIQPAENLTVYTTTDTSWFTSPLGKASPPVHQLASNVIALIVLPRSSSADAAASGAQDPITSVVTNYQYDTRANTAVTIHNQLPPIVEVAMVVIDEASAARLQPNTPAQPAVIQTALTRNSRFQVSASMDADLDALENDLSGSHIKYRTFRTLVPLHNSKWSAQ